MTPPQTITTEQTTSLLAWIARPGTTEHHAKLAIRNTAIALLMLDAGLRSNEVCLLLQADLYWQGVVRPSLEIRPEIAKRRRGRNVPISPRLATALTNYYQAWIVSPPAEPWDYLFWSTDPNRRLSTRQIRRMIESTAREALGIDVHPHMLRHTFGDRLRRCKDLRTVQQLLGSDRHLVPRSIYTHPGSTSTAARPSPTWTNQTREHQNDHQRMLRRHPILHPTSLAPRNTNGQPHRTLATAPHPTTLPNAHRGHAPQNSHHENDTPMPPTQTTVIHLADGDPPTYCGLPHIEDRVLYVVSLWHSVPPGLQCWTCSEVYEDNQLHGHN